MRTKPAFGWDAQEILATILVVRKMLQRTRGTRYTVPTTIEALRWHTSRRPYLNGPSRNHVWLERDGSVLAHAIGFAEGIVYPGTLTAEERWTFTQHFGTPPLRFFAAMKKAPKRKPKRAKPTTSKKHAALVKSIEAHESELKSVERRARFLKKKLRSERAQLRATKSALLAAPVEETASLSDAELARLLASGTVKA